MTHGADEREAFLKALQEVPFISRACRKAGIARATVYRWMEEDLEFRIAVKKQIQKGHDLLGEAAYAVVQEKIKERNFAAARFFLLHFRSLYGVKQSEAESEDETAQEKAAPEEPWRSALVDENGYMTVSKQMAEYLKQFDHDDDAAPQEPKRERSALEDEDGNLIVNRKLFDNLVQQGDLTENDLAGEVSDNPDAPGKHGLDRSILPNFLRIRQRSAKQEPANGSSQPEHDTS